MLQSQPSQSDYDVIVVGGGPAGSATAMSLVQAGVRSVLLLEASQYRQSRVGESLIPDVRQCFNRLAMSHEFLDACHVRTPGTASSWGSGTLGYNDFVCHPLGNGWHLDRRAFDHHLALTAAERGVEVCVNCRCQEVTDTTAGSGLRVTVKTDAGHRQVETGYIVDATGLSARIARQQGAHRTIADQLTVIYGYFSLPESSAPGDQTLLEACEYGWWYRSRLPDNKMIVSVSCDSSYFSRQRLHNWQCWLDCLAGTRYLSGGLCGARFDPASLKSTATVTGRLWPQYGPGWMAVGDAATSVDPVLGIGIVKSLDDGINAGLVIAKALAGDRTAGDQHQALRDQWYRDYLQQHQYLYGLERRWPDSEFWRQRHHMAAPEA